VAHNQDLWQTAQAYLRLFNVIVFSLPSRRTDNLQILDQGSEVFDSRWKYMFLFAVDEKSSLIYGLNLKSKRCIMF
jgi:hypothetical protein